jgi:hypothetical protein
MNYFERKKTLIKYDMPRDVDKVCIQIKAFIIFVDR